MGEGKQLHKSAIVQTAVRVGSDRLNLILEKQRRVRTKQFFNTQLSYAFKR